MFERQLAIFAVACGIAFVTGKLRADDTTQGQQQQVTQTAATTDGSAKTLSSGTNQTTTQTSSKKSNVAAVASPTPAASKVDLTTPASKLNFYGMAEMGVESATLKSGACKTVRATDSYYQLRLGTDIKLSDDVTMGIEVGSTRSMTRFR